MAKSALKSLGLASAMALLAGTAAMAHHSYAAFDRTRTVTITGTVSEVEWTNPHTWVFLMVTGADGKSERWAVEGDPPGGMARAGWLRTSAKPGDKVVLTINPMITGQLGGHYVTAVLPGNLQIGRHSDQVAGGPTAVAKP